MVVDRIRYWVVSGMLFDERPAVSSSPLGLHQLVQFLPVVHLVVQLLLFLVLVQLAIVLLYPLAVV